MNYSNLTIAEKRNLLLSSERVFFKIETRLNTDCVFEYIGATYKRDCASITKYVAHRLDKSKYTFCIPDFSMNVKVTGENVIDCYSFDFLDRKMTCRLHLEKITILEVVPTSK